jgi:acyl carrier protein
MTEIEIYNTVKNCAEEILQHHNNRLVITPQSDITKDLDFDYIDKIKFYSLIENKLKLDFNEMEIEALDTIDEIIYLSLSKLEAHGKTA